MSLRREEDGRKQEDTRWWRRLNSGMMLSYPVRGYLPSHCSSRKGIGTVEASRIIMSISTNAGFCIDII